MSNRYRYPGISSFEASDADIFFGRDQDRQRLADFVETEKTVLLYSRSGLGKSSLLKAALIPEMEARGYRPFYVRLQLHRPEDSLPPVQTVLRQTLLKDRNRLPATFLQKFLNRSNSLWYAFKAEAMAAADSDKPVLLIFDQFEEVGSYPPRQVEEFKRQLAELLYTALPRDYSEALDDPNLLAEPLTDQETDLLYKPLRVKAVFAIRSDQMSVLNELTSHLPNILKVFYELKALSPAQARQAIVNPAQFAGDFATPTFTYAPDALEKLLHELTDERNREVDTAQLQILLQYIERKVVAQEQQTRIAAADLGDLRAVYENYYRDRLNELPDRAERERARELIEERLIAEGRRISYDIALCLQMVKPETLDRLVEARLLRREPNSLGSYSYELSHDTLVAPVSEARAQREEEEARREEERRQAEALREAQEKAEADRREKEKTARQLRTVRTLLALAIVALAVAVGGIWYAFEQRKKAIEIAAIAEKRKQEAETALIASYEAKIKEWESTRFILASDGKTQAAQAYSQQIDSLQNVIKAIQQGK